VYFVSFDDILMWIYLVQFTVYCLRLPIFACYSWEMALNVVFHASFDDVQAGKGIREKAGELDSLKLIHTAYDKTSR
jgi:hypothetical protein